MTDACCGKLKVVYANYMLKAIELVRLMPAKAPVQANECLIANQHPIDGLNSIGAWCSYFSTKINGHIMSMLHSSTAIARHQIDFGYKQGMQLQIKTTNM